MRCVRLHEPRYPHLQWLFAIPNGGWRKKAVAQKLKAEGVRRGVLDYGWPYRTADYPGLFIELKTMTNGRPSKEQRAFAAFAEANGYKVVFARGWEEAWRAVCEYAGIPYSVT